MNTRIRGGGQASESRLPLSEPRLLAERAFRRADVPAVRRFGRAFGGRSGMAAARLADFVLAVSEASACATAWGPCTARVRLWMAGRRAFCEVNGDGLMMRRIPPAASSSSWHPAGCQDEEEVLRRLVLTQVSDYVSVAASPSGVRVVFSMTVA
jgi:hypothetical protein